MNLALKEIIVIVSILFTVLFEYLYLKERKKLWLQLIVGLSLFHFSIIIFFVHNAVINLIATLTLLIFSLIYWFTKKDSSKSDVLVYKIFGAFVLWQIIRLMLRFFHP